MSDKKLRRLAVVISGWHYPLHFYDRIVRQKIPKGWKVDYFCISHRDPSFAMEEKRTKVLGDSQREKLDKILYQEMATVKDLAMLGIEYTEEPNTIGDWGNSNQWLEKNDYTKYDLFLFTHDDNLILSNRWFHDIITDGAYEEWEIMCNSVGMPKGTVRGSCEFFKKSFMDRIGGKFDLSEVTLKRVGETTVSEDRNELYDWNSTLYPLMRFIQKENIQVGYLSPAYRVSGFVIEGERGYISNTHGANTAEEEIGFKFLTDNKII